MIFIDKHKWLTVHAGRAERERDDIEAGRMECLKGYKNIRQQYTTSTTFTIDESFHHESPLGVNRSTRHYLEESKKNQKEVEKSR